MHIAAPLTASQRTRGAGTGVDGSRCLFFKLDLHMRRPISRAWTEEEVNSLRAHARKGTASRTIAIKLRRTLGAVRARASAEGIVLSVRAGKTAINPSPEDHSTRAVTD